MVNIIVNNVVSRIDGKLPAYVQERIHEAVSYQVVGAEHSQYGKEIYCPKCRKLTREATTTDLYLPDYPESGIKGYRKCLVHGWVKPIQLWDGQRCLYEGRAQTFPTGVISRIVEVLKSNNIQFTITDNRIVPVTRELPWKGLTPRFYQQNAVRAIKKRTRGIIHAATGTGKTLCISWLIKQLGVNTLILTHTKSVFNQVTKSIADSLGVPVGQIGDGICDIHNFTVSMPQSLTETVTVKKPRLVKGVWKDVNVKEQRIRPALIPFLNSIEMLIVDEAHHLSASTCQLIANNCPNAYYRMGVSATPWRDDLLDILIEAVTGRTAYLYTATQAIEAGYLARPNIHLVKFNLGRQPTQGMRKVVKKVGRGKNATMTVVQEFGKLTYADLYDSCIVNNDRRNILIERIALKEYAQGKSVLIIVKMIKHGENLLERLKDLKNSDGTPDVRFVNGNDNPEYLQQTLNELDQKKFHICIATGIFSEGVDIRRLDVVINTTASDSSVNAMQTVGRALRKVPGKEVVDIYDISDYGARWFTSHSSNRKLIYETEPGYIITEEDSSEY